MNIKHLLIKDKRNNVNKSMSKINTRKKILNSRTQNYYISKAIEQIFINDVNKKINKL